ncbi:MAG: response regulator [Thermodesulfovibrionales bacterium]
MKSLLRVLHLEDNAFDAEFVKTTLEEEGIACDMLRVETRADYISAIDKGNFDIIFADYSLPSFDGLSALAIATEKCPDIPFIFVTGNMGEERAIETLKSGATDYVLKNGLSRLVPSVRRSLREATERIKRKEAEEELQRSREELRNFSSHLQAAREEDRARIAREIHDELGRGLMAVKMDLSWLKKKYKDDAVLTEKSAAMTRVIDETIRSVKTICAELRPGLLDTFGLSAAVEWEAKVFEKRTGIDCEVTVSPKDIVTDEKRSSAVFRIFQEALTNVALHAKATKVTARLEKLNGNIVMSISDNGRGISEKDISKSKCFGLIGMKERVHSFGGELEINGVPNKGTTIIINIPTN